MYYVFKYSERVKEVERERKYLSLSLSKLMKTFRVQSRYGNVALPAGLAHIAHQVVRLHQPHPLLWSQSTGILSKIGFGVFSYF